MTREGETAQEPSRKPDGLIFENGNDPDRRPGSFADLEGHPGKEIFILERRGKRDIVIEIRSLLAEKGASSWP